MYAKFKKTLLLGTHKSIVFIFISLLFLLILLIGVGVQKSNTLTKNNDVNVVAKVNGEPIVVKEYEAELAILKPDVQNYFRTKYNASVSKDFWNRKFEEETPLEVLKNRALDEVVRKKIELSLGKKYKLIDFTSYKDLLNNLKKENELRKKAIENGEVIYGLSSYNEAQYYNYIISNLRINLKDVLSRSKDFPLYVPDDEVRAKYEENIDAWSTKDTSYTIQKISIIYKSMEERKEKYLIAQKALEELKSGIGFEEVAKTYNENNKILTQVFNNDSIKDDMRSSPGIRQMVETMKINEYTNEIIEENGSFNIIKLIKQENKIVDAYEENYESIKRMVIDEKYDEYINRLINQAEISIYKSNIEKIILPEAVVE